VAFFNCQSRKDNTVFFSKAILWCAFVAILLLGTRHINSADLGYHLAFGESFFKSGKIVDHTSFIYTLPQQATPVFERPEPGPGNWYDIQGRYHFPNANWLSQIIIYGTWFIGGAAGLSILQLILVFFIFLLLVKGMLIAKVPAHLASLAILLIGLILNPRLTMRPELFGYLCLVAQFTMIINFKTQQDQIAAPSWYWAGGMMFWQLLFVNFHSYFLLGLALMGALLLENILLFIKKGFIDKATNQFWAFKKVINRHIITLLGMLLICFANPWGWRLVLLPFQTLFYMKKNAIGGERIGAHIHPWDLIHEFGETIPEGWPILPSDYAELLMFILSTVVLLSLFVIMLITWLSQKKKNGAIVFHKHKSQSQLFYLIIIIAMVFVGLSLRRNSVVAGMIIIPSALISLTCTFFYYIPQNFRIGRNFFTLASTLIIGLSIYGSYLILSGMLYDAEKIFNSRFGFGVSKSGLPIGIAEWLNKFAPNANIYCDFDSSSTIHFFTHPHKKVPILTNTWAYPPQILFENESYRVTALPFNVFANQHFIDAAILTSPGARPLISKFSSGNEWKMVYVDGKYSLFLRSNNKYKDLATKHEIREDNFEVNAFVTKQLSKKYPLEGTIFPTVETFAFTGKLDLAINVLEEVIKHIPTNITTWKKLLSLYNNRGIKRKREGDNRFIGDHNQVISILEKIIELDPKDLVAQKKLNSIKR
jgi:hypothetical protein